MMHLFIAGQFYIVGTPPDMLGGPQRNIAPRGNMQMSRDTLSSRSGVPGEPVSRNLLVWVNIDTSSHNLFSILERW